MSGSITFVHTHHEMGLISAYKKHRLIPDKIVSGYDVTGDMLKRTKCILLSCDFPSTAIIPAVDLTSFQIASATSAADESISVAASLHVGLSSIGCDPYSPHAKLNEILRRDVKITWSQDLKGKYSDASFYVQKMRAITEWSDEIHRSRERYSRLAICSCLVHSYLPDELIFFSREMFLDGDDSWFQSQLSLHMQRVSYAEPTFNGGALCDWIIVMDEPSIRSAHKLATDEEIASILVVQDHWAGQLAKCESCLTINLHDFLIRRKQRAEASEIKWGPHKFALPALENGVCMTVTSLCSSLVCSLLEKPVTDPLYLQCLVPMPIVFRREMDYQRTINRLTSDVPITSGSVTLYWETIRHAPLYGDSDLDSGSLNRPLWINIKQRVDGEYVCQSEYEPIGIAMALRLRDLSASFIVSENFIKIDALSAGQSVWNLRFLDHVHHCSRRKSYDRIMMRPLSSEHFTVTADGFDPSEYVIVHHSSDIIDAIIEYMCSISPVSLSIGDPRSLTSCHVWTRAMLRYLISTTRARDPLDRVPALKEFLTETANESSMVIEIPVRYGGEAKRDKVDDGRVQTEFEAFGVMDRHDPSVGSPQPVHVRIPRALGLIMPVNPSQNKKRDSSYAIGSPELNYQVNLALALQFMKECLMERTSIGSDSSLQSDILHAERSNLFGMNFLFKRDITDSNVIISSTYTASDGQGPVYIAMNRVLVDAVSDDPWMKPTYSFPLTGGVCSIIGDVVETPDLSYLNALRHASHANTLHRMLKDKSYEPTDCLSGIWEHPSLEKLIEGSGKYSGPLFILPPHLKLEQASRFSTWSPLVGYVPVTSKFTASSESVLAASAAISKEGCIGQPILLIPIDMRRNISKSKTRIPWTVYCAVPKHDKSVSSDIDNQTCHRALHLAKSRHPFTKGIINQYRNGLSMNHPALIDVKLQRHKSKRKPKSLFLYAPEISHNEISGHAVYMVLTYAVFSIPLIHRMSQNLIYGKRTYAELNSRLSAPYHSVIEYISSLRLITTSKHSVKTPSLQALSTFCAIALGLCDFGQELVWKESR